MQSRTQARISWNPCRKACASFAIAACMASAASFPRAGHAHAGAAVEAGSEADAEKGNETETASLSPSERIALSNRSQRFFSSLNFFAEGGGMHLPPGVWRFRQWLRTAPTRFFVGALGQNSFESHWGLTLRKGQPVGVFDESYVERGGRRTSVGVLGCVACHAGKADGQFIIGLGNKNIDVGAIGKDVRRLGSLWKRVGHFPTRKSDDYRRIENEANEFSAVLADARVTNLTQGLIPTSMIRRWFYRMAGEPLPEAFPRAAAKVPALWGYGPKREVGQFCDGLGNGKHAGWGIAVELAAGQRPEVVRSYLPKIEAAEKELENFLPPAYARTIDQAGASRGKELFSRACAGCHGTYEVDAGGLPVYKAPAYFAWEVVRTDRDRLDGNTPEFLELIRRNPLNDVVQAMPGQGQGYFAPRLVGIWARFPYLHNGSVPSIRALLSPASQRPRAFSLRGAGERHRFDPGALGLTVPAPGSKEEALLLKQARKGMRDVYFTERDGQSNQGHEFHTGLREAEKSDLIEYLKTL